ncbi:zinc-binding dehydrogenase [Agromyces sp. MMS17-SY077]|uniref:Zinc-binding dehydrogenase n=2 Tax=Agromyces seonyuensis TaxID=2662446 RepID=A0A6I4P2J2_9MICO|nr:zinc-binding dehydrogenase [Agromyces seonyuensis]
MRAALADRFGPPEVVRIGEAPRPEPGAHELLVRLRASTVSIADHRLRSRSVPRGLGLLVGPAIGFRRPKHRILGMEGAGVVEAIGSAVTRWQPGDEVVLMRGAAFGCHAEYAVVAEDGQLARKPAELSFEEAAAIVFGGHTALRYLDVVELGPGTSVLVNGASGAVGTALVQLAAARGAEVVAVTSGRNADLVRSLGAGRVIDYTSEDFTASGERFDVVVDCVGNVPLARLRNTVRTGGTLLLVIVGLGGMLAGGWHARRAGIRVDRDGAPGSADLMERLVAEATAGRLRPVVDRTYPLEEIVEAHRYVDTGRKRGNVVLTVSPVE